MSVKIYLHNLFISYDHYLLFFLVVLIMILVVELEKDPLRLTWKSLNTPSSRTLPLLSDDKLY